MTTSTAVYTATVNRPKFSDENDTSQFRIFDESEKHDGGYMATFKNLRNYGLLVGSLVGFTTGGVIELCYQFTYEECDLVLCFFVYVLSILMIVIQRSILLEYIQTHVSVVVNKASDSNAETDENRELMLKLIRSTQKYEFLGYIVGMCIGSTFVDVLIGVNMPILPLMAVGGILMRIHVRTWLRTGNEERFITKKDSILVSQSHISLLSEQTIPVTLV